MTARVLVAAGLALLAFDAADFTITGIAVLGALIIVIGAWVGGLFTREAWICDDETSTRCAAIDAQLDAEARR